MSVLAPWFLAGFVLIAGPIIAHLIRRATRDRVPFSTLRFLEPSPPRLDRRNRVQNPWLLALRCLIVAVLALGFARPFFREKSPSLAATAPIRHVVVVLDESASMQRVGLWDAARARVNAVVAELKPTDSFALLGAGTTVTELVGARQWLAASPTDRPALVQAVLASRIPGWGPTPLDSAAEAALARWEDMAESGDAPSRRELIIVSDFAAGSRTAGLANLEWPANARVTLAEIAPASTGNASLQWLGWSEPAEGKVSARVRISRSFDAPESLRLQWRDARTHTPLGNPESVTLLPGASEVRLLALPEKSPAAVQLDLEGDAQPFDNHLWLLRAPPRELTLGYLGTDDVNDSQHARFYLQRAISGWREPVTHLSSDLAALSATTGLIVVNASPTDAQLRELHERLSAGTFILVLISDPALIDTAASLAGETGWTAAKSERSDALLGQLDFQHPLFAPFADPLFSDFTRIHFWQPHGVSLPNSSKAQVVARFDDRNPAVIEASVGQGRLVVWAGDWTPTSSQWVLSSKFVPWLQALAERATGGRSRPVTAEIGDTARLLGSSEPAEWRRLDSPASDATFTSAPTAPGLYQFKQGNEIHEVTLLVPSAESDTQVLPLDMWEQLGVPLKLTDSPSAVANADVSGATNAAALESRQSIWRWLLWTAAALLAFESLASFAVGRDGSPSRPRNLADTPSDPSLPTVPQTPRDGAPI